MMAIKNTPWTLSASSEVVSQSIVSQQFNKLRKQTIKLDVRAKERERESMRSKGDVCNPQLIKWPQGRLTLYKIDGKRGKSKEID